MKTIKEIIKALDDYLIDHDTAYLTLGSANTLLEKEGLITSPEKSKHVLKKILEENKIPHAYQTTKKPIQWRIPLSIAGFRRLELLDQMQSVNKKGISKNDKPTNKVAQKKTKNKDSQQINVPQGNWDSKDEKQKKPISAIGVIIIVTLSIFIMWKSNYSSNSSSQPSSSKPTIGNTNTTHSCQTERNYILSQTNRIEEAVRNLESNYSELSITAFEIFLANWNNDFDYLREEINSYNYYCFQYSGIKGLATLAMQLGLGYIDIVMYNDKRDVIETKRRFIDKKNAVLESLSINE